MSRRSKYLFKQNIEDVPLFCDEPPTILVFKSAEQKEAYENAADEEKIEMEKELAIKNDK